MTPLPEDEPPAPEELQDVVTRAKDLPLEALSASDEIPNPFFCRCWDTNGHELAGSIQTS